MPCRWSRRCRAAPSLDRDAVSASTESPDMEDWKKVRRGYLRQMRRQTRFIIILMAAIEAIRVGPVQLAYAGRHGFPAPGENDFGIAYTTGYFLSWVYVCAFMIIYVPFFSWWVDTKEMEPSEDSLVKKTAELLKKVNLALLPMAIGACLIRHVWYTLQTFIYVDSRPVGSFELPKNTRKNWLVRLMLLLGIAISLFCGHAAFQILDHTDLAHVKFNEYLMIVVPIQINIGMLFGSIMQYKMEKRIAKKKQMALASAKNEEAMIGDEKVALLDN